MLHSIKTTRFNVTVRRIATGCDFHISLFARDEATACERAKDRARFAERISRAKLATLEANGIAVFRVVSSGISPDQSRPIG
ncbi:hypothetical protein [Bradyrhizobium sp. ERR14]|uniref:hypothetical protein n=1 Tax=Bradyrhizobium sp. ERR14 TaxID=2663837 RepID=UPI001607A271|nr:hypothetical protein [Bradyrhizobium sp. ERR14]MBB4398725.1 hypothetical protein [Bradyrhizobium sp. ERR14]